MSRKKFLAKAVTFDQILATGVRQGQLPARSRRSKNWFREAAKNTSVTPQKLLKEHTPKLIPANRFEYGNMYLFNYDPKWKKELPYYDTWPLIFPIDPKPNGFLGINLHYLPLEARAKLMDKLYSIRTDNSYNEQTKLAISYSVLKSASKFKYFEPCVKWYLWDHVRSKFLWVESVEWDIALFLPLARFQKKSQEEVWKDSMARFTFRNRAKKFVKKVFKK